MTPSTEKIIALSSIGNLDILARCIVDDFSQLEPILQLFVVEMGKINSIEPSKVTQRQMDIWQALNVGFDELRMAVERQRPREMAIMERLQAIISRDVIKKNEGPICLIILQILNDAKVEILPVLGKAINEFQGKYSQFQGSPSSFQNSFSDSEVSGQQNALSAGQDMIKSVASLNSGNTFAIANELSKPLEHLSPETRAQTLMMSIALSQEPSVRDLAGLFCLDKHPVARKFFLDFLVQPGVNLGTGNTLRRLIVMRNWLPEAERPLVDGAVRALRIAGLECAPVKLPSQLKLVSFGVDGSGGWGFLGYCKNRNSTSIFGFVARINYGIRDAWIEHNASKEEFRNMEEKIKSVKDSGGVLSNKSAMLLINHAIITGLNEGRTPSRDVLELSEILGCQEWVNPESSLAVEMNRIRLQLQRKNSPEEFFYSVIGSNKWSKYSIFKSWFEDDIVVDNILTEVFGINSNQWSPDPKIMATCVERVLDEVILKRLSKWIECLNILAIMSENAESKKLPSPLECVFLSDYPVFGTGIKNVPFFIMLARQSVEAAYKRLKSGRG